MNSRENSSRSTNNVTNLDDVRKARALANAAKANATATDAVSELSAKTNAEPTHEELHGNRRFDAVKVARIKAAIAAGEYHIDYGRVADKFIEHDRNQ